jgi:tRNA threonylcarbamoyladenosine biosynthesis protein TsaB
MLILTLRTDKPQSEIGLYDDQKQLSYKAWEAHRQLAETLHSMVANLLQFEDRQWSDLEGIVVYRGPGSYTGLRIGISVANALAGSLEIPVVGVQREDWLKTGVEELLKGKSHKIVLPQYGGNIFTTPPKK